MRGRKNGNGAPQSSPANPAVERQDERDLDGAYAALSEALRLWRRTPDDPGRKAALVLAYDRKEDLLLAVAAEDERRRELEDRPHVPG